jgi:hypothetical protein
VSEPKDIFKGKLVENKEVPFENLAYATTDVLTQNGQGIIMYGTRGVFLKITEIMNEKREFNRKDLFPKEAPIKGLYDEILKSFEDMEVLENLGDGNYRAKEKVLVARGKFKLPR